LKAEKKWQHKNFVRRYAVLSELTVQFVQVLEVQFLTLAVVDKLLLLNAVRCGHKASTFFSSHSLKVWKSATVASRNQKKIRIWAR
jgi:hypothetical protein